MCTHCGCSPHSHEHSHDHFSHHPHTHEHEKISIEEHILSHNEAHARENHAYFHKNNIFAINLVSSPGSGKTTLIAQTAKSLARKVQVIVGDQETEYDAERLRKSGIQAEQIQTGKGCHLDAHSVGHALEHLNPEQNSLLFIENVGNLVCPTDFNLGENIRVVLLSLTEGEDKPLKYPHIFASAQVLIITKIDLASYLSCSIELCIENALKVNPNLKVFCISNTTQEGFSQWTDYLHTQMLPFSASN